MSVEKKYNHIFTTVYEDNHLIAVNKRSGVLVQGDATGDKPLVDWVKDYLKEKYQKEGNVFCGVIHRIDRPVSGLVLLAKTSKGLERMNEVFRENKVKKTYLAITERRPKNSEDTLINWLRKDSKKHFAIVYNTEVKDSLKSELSFTLLSELNPYYLLEVRPVTGRFHQIRAQLSKIGCSIVGDVKYKGERPNDDASICLHAFKINFIHPIKNEPVEIKAEVPQNKYWEKVRL